MDYHYTSNLATDLGRISYSEAYRLQKHLLDLVKKGTRRGFLLFLEHEPVYTLGRKPIRENYEGVETVQTERGGDVTYHGPGQKVIYPIVDISENGNVDVRSFVHFVEDTVIGILNKAGYEASVGEEPGIWVRTDTGEKKVASLGMAIDHGISYHGISINTSEAVLEGFSRIRPCGLDPSVMSYAGIGQESIIQGFVNAFSKKFGDFSLISSEDFLRDTSFSL